MKRALLPFWLIILLVLILTSPGNAGERQSLGFGHVFDNDAIGDGDDRWRTGSYAFSYFRGLAWHGALPARPGELMEWRFRSEIIAPSNLSGTAITSDRRYVGAMSVGALTHFARGGVEFSLGGDLVFIGPQTGLSDFQKWFHRQISSPAPRSSVNQLGNNVFPTLTLEAGRELALSGLGNMRVRPFVETQAGVETFVRLGGDVTVGGMGMGGFRTRDVTSGQRIAGISDESDGGLSLLLGGDVAYVSDSHYLPSRLGYRLKDLRNRLRVGVEYERHASTVFYGVTWLSKEFKAQTASQVIGTLSLHLNF